MRNFLKRVIILSMAVFCFMLCGASASEAASDRDADEAAHVHSSSTMVETLSLQQCIHRALSRNLTLKQGLQKLANREQEIRSVRATAYPQLGFEGSYTRIGNLTKYDFGEGVKVSFIPEDNYLTKLTLSQILYSGGQVRAALRLAEAARKSVEFEHKLSQELTVMMVIIDFYNALLADELIQVAEETLNSVAAHVENVKQMKEQGLASDFDLLRAQVELANVKPMLIRSKNQRAIAYARLVDILQMKDVTLQLKGSLTPLYKPPLEKHSEALKRAIAHRWELKVLQANMNVLRENLAVKKGAFKPSMVFFGNYDWSNDEVDLATGDTNWNEGWNFGLAANWSIFDGFKRSADVAKAKGELRLLELEKQKLINSIDLELIESGQQLKEAQQLMESQSKNVDQARKGLAIAEVRYKQGVSTQLEVLDSRTALTAARSNYALAQHSLILAGVKMLRARGELLDRVLKAGSVKESEVSSQKGNNAKRNEK